MDNIIVMSLTREEREALKEIPEVIRWMRDRVGAVNLRDVSDTGCKSNGAEPGDLTYMTADEIRIVCRCSVSLVRQAMSTGALPSTSRRRGKGGKFCRYSEKFDVISWMNRGAPGV